jgi:integrase/recombinase XerD
VFYIPEFLDSLKDFRYGLKTIKDYGYLLRHFQRFCQDSGIQNSTAITEDHVHGYLRSLGDRQIGGKSYYVRVKRLAKYFRYLEEQGHLFLSPFREVRVHNYRKATVTTLSTDEMEQILSGIKTNHPLCLKGKAILELAYSSALRPREIYSLKISDIDFKKGLLYIEQSKNRKDRIVPVGKEALFWVNRYISEVRPRYLKNPSNTFVFINHKTGKPLTVWGVRWVVRQTLQRSGFTPIKPSCLRSSAATALLENGMGVVNISTLLGHVEIRTTQLYLNVQTRKLKTILRQKHPRESWGATIQS